MSPSAAAEENNKKMLTLKTSDNECFKEEEAVALQSQTIKHMIVDDYAEGGIPLPNVTAPILAKVIEYCKEHEITLPILVPETENQGVCISLAYCPRTDDIVASYRSKVEFSDETVLTQPMLTPSRAIGKGTVGSHVLLKRAGSRFLKLGSSYSNVCDIGLPKSAIINVENRGTLFASEDKLSSELVLEEVSSSSVQRLNLQQSPVHDVKYTSSLRNGILSCLNGDTLQLFSTKRS